MKLFLIRHAESANNRLALGLTYDEYMAQRSADPVITELGQRQAKRLADHLACETIPESHHETRPDNGNGGYHLTHLYCSPMRRALQTSLPIAQALGLNPEVWVDIHEHGGMFHGNPRNGGELVIHPGLTRAEMQQEFPDCVVPNQVTEEGWWASGYEDSAGCYARAVRVANDLRHRAQVERAQKVESRLALVSHGTFLDALIKALLNQPPERETFYFHYNTAISRLDFMPNDRLCLRYLNRVQHLPPEMISE